MIEMGYDYGLKPMTLEEEFNAPKAIKNTRNAKCNAINKLNLVRRAVDSLEHYMKRIPELDDAEHSARVMELSDQIVKACEGVWDCIR